MKAKFFITAVLVMFFASGVFAQSEKAYFKTDANTEKAKKKIEKKLNKKNGVEAATLNLETSIVSVTYDKTDVQRADIQNVITKMGYEAQPITTKKTAKRRGCGGCGHKPNGCKK